MSYSNLWPRPAVIVACSLLMAASGHAAESIPDGLKLESIQVWPTAITLEHRLDHAQLLLTGHLSSGEQIDVTRMAQLTTESELVDISEHRLITPRKDGQQTLEFELDGVTAEVSVLVRGAGQQKPVSFVRDVAPALSKMGCNAGTCHGSREGQRGFKLSLRGYDYLFDHQALTDDLSARRFNRANPDQSLMLLKTSGSVAHVGGVLTRPKERNYEILRSWILDGGKLDLQSPRVTSIQLLPENPILPRAKLKQQMVVLAHYSDGAVRDVTQDAFVESGNIEILSADKTGLLTTLRRGEAPVLARYEGTYTATTITIMGDRTGFVWAEPPTNNYVDEHVYGKLQRVKIQPSDICTDAEFIRRVYLDLTGLPPEPEAINRFLADDRDTRTKRNELIDQLLGSAEYVEHWTNKWADLLQVNRKHLGEIGAAALRDWIKNSVATNKPYNQFAYEVITATGSTLDHPAAAYWKILREPTVAMENTTHLFLAVRFNCNKCHDHPFERWTQDQYYSLTAFFAQVGRKEDPAFAGQKIGGSAVESAVPLVEVIYDSGAGETKHDRTGELVAPAFPYKHTFEANSDNRREQLGRWITSPNNRYFASSFVNRLWGYMLGTGLIEPIDDIRAGNPPTNPELLAALTHDFIESGFDTQHMLRTICQSRVYQHSVRTNQWNEDDTINYSHAIPRRLPAEVLFDAIHLAAGSTPHIPGVPAGFRAAELPDAGIKLPFLDDFGRPARESSCECERTSGVVLGPIMKLINGPTVNNAITDPQSELTKLVATEPDDRRLVEQVFLRFLGRKPTSRELEFGIESLVAAKGDDQQVRTQYDQRKAKLLQQQPQWEEALVGDPVWVVLRPTNLESSAGASFTPQDDQSILVGGELGQDTYTFHTETSLPTVTGFRVELLPDASLPEGGPGRAPNGNLVLSELQVSARPIGGGDGQATPVALQNATATFSQEGWNVTGAIDNNPGTGWGISPKFNQAHTATFETAEDVRYDGGAHLTIQIQQMYGDGKHNLGRFRLSVTDSRRPLRKTDLPEGISKIVNIPRDDRSDEQVQQLTDYFLDRDAELKNLKQALEMATQQSQQYRLTGVQDLAWALINSPAFLFNR